MTTSKRLTILGLTMLVLVTLSVVSVGIHVVPASAASPSLSEAPLNPEFATWQQSRAAGVATQAK
ncbi:MAG: hypothetical protein ACXV3E_05505, partial [Halobacteriota archaeon]